MLCCFVLISAVSAANAAANETYKKKITYIFLQEGIGGSFVKDNESGNYTLTITGVVPYTMYFSDRPARMAGFAPMDKFLNGFCFGSGNPPNAAVWLKDEPDDSNMIVVELTAPNYDEANQTLTYTAKVLNNFTFAANWSQDLIQNETPDAAIPEKFGAVGLVIDDCPNGDVTCCEGKYIWSHCCGKIDNVGCCWYASAVQCGPCHDYTSECVAKYGNTCSHAQASCSAY